MPDEAVRYEQLWYKCLQQHGAKIDVGRNPHDRSQLGLESRDAQFDEAQKSCWQKEPELLTERAAREDPDFRDKADRWVTCLKSHTIVATVQDDGILSLPNGLPPAPNDQWLDKCEAEAFKTK